MAQARWTGLSMGGPTYVEDPRVTEQIALGQLLLQNRQAANAQADRLFQRKQDVAGFDERRRQFDEQQKRLADAAKMQQADADRQFGLAEREAALREAAAQEAVAEHRRQAEGDAADRLFRREQAATSAQQFTTEQERLKRAEDERAYAAIDERGFQREEARLKREHDIRMAQDAYWNQQGLEAGRDRRAAENARSQDEREARRADAAFRRQKALLESRAEADRLERQAEQEKLTGTKEQQRAAALTARDARFRAKLDELTKNGKESLSDDDQAEAVKRALTAATTPDLDPERITREQMVLGPEGEAESQARLRAIVEEFFPKTYRNKLPSWLEILGRAQLGDPKAGGLGFLKLGDMVVPAAVEDFIGRHFKTKTAGGPNSQWELRSGGVDEADRLFKRK